jgi:uncharacterized protein with HEPN domain
MQPEIKDAAYQWDMLQAARDILDFTAGVSFEQFSKDKICCRKTAARDRGSGQSRLRIISE